MDSLERKIIEFENEEFEVLYDGDKAVYSYPRTTNATKSQAKRLIKTLNTK